MDVCARCAGGNNAGHTIVVHMGPDKVKTKFDFHLLPSGLVNPRCAGFIGSGVVVHVPSFFAELDTLQKKGASRGGGGSSCEDGQRGIVFSRCTHGTSAPQASTAMDASSSPTALTSSLTSTKWSTVSRRWSLAEAGASAANT